MKFRLVILLTFVAVSLFGQVKVGALVSYNTPLASEETIRISNENNILVSDATFMGTSNSTGFGVLTQYETGYLFARGEAIYNKYTQKYNISNGSLIRSKEKEINEQFTNVDLNILAGVKMGMIRVGVGPSIHVLAKHESNFQKMDGYNSRKMRPMKYGFIGNVGVDFGRFHLDARYVKNFGTITDHVKFYNKASKFKSNLSAIQIVLGVTI